MNAMQRVCSRHGAYLGEGCPSCMAKRGPSLLQDQPRPDREQLAERSKIMLGRSVNGEKELWWRVTIYVGDTREDIDCAVGEALRVDEWLRCVA
jgi:hypothetical protein